jgi:hypothetical protein
MSQTLNFVLAFDGTNYGYWKVRMRFFLKSIDCWSIVETGWTKPEDATLELVPQKNARLSTYEGTKLVKSAKLQLLISRFEEIKMLEEETFGEFYSKMSASGTPW